MNFYFISYPIYAKKKNHTKSSLKAYIKDQKIKAKCSYCYAADLHNLSALK